MSFLKLQAPAKINLFLKILGRRENGYHDLAMVMEKVSLCDEIVLEKIAEGIELCDVRCAMCDVPTEKNLVYLAALFIREISNTYPTVPLAGVGHLLKGPYSKCPTLAGGVKIILSKNIPMGGGLGGGSADAAAVLKGLNELWGLNLPVEKLVEIGVRLGADVPFFLYDGPAKVEGTGERITPIQYFPKLWIILINPGVHVDTAWAYKTWDAMRSQAPREGENQLTQENQSVSFPRTFDFGGLVKLLHNDFEAVVFEKFPEIREAKEKLLTAGAQGALMSGSGSTVFGLFETKEKRDGALGHLKGKPHWQVFAVENRN